MQYRNFNIEVRKEDEGYSGNSYRVDDGWELDCWWNPSIKTKKDAIKECKITIDDYYENPSDFEG